jgi:plasmid stabilization system protein ParE
VISKLVHSIELIGMKPDIGRPLRRENVREWTVPGLPYVIPYRITSEEVIILRVYHTRRRCHQAWK